MAEELETLGRLLLLHQMSMFSFSKGLPRVSVAEERDSINVSRRSTVLFTPLVILLQYLTNSSFVMASLTPVSDGCSIPAAASSAF